MRKYNNNQIVQNIDKILFITNQSPINNTIQMNGFQDCMIKMHSALQAKRAEKSKIKNDSQLESEYFHEMIKNLNNTRYLRYIADILGCDLSKYYTEENKGPTVDPKTLSVSGDPFFFQ